MAAAVKITVHNLCSTISSKKKIESVSLKHYQDTQKLNYKDADRQNDRFIQSTSHLSEKNFLDIDKKNPLVFHKELYKDTLFFFLQEFLQLFSDLSHSFPSFQDLESLRTS